MLVKGAVADAVHHRRRRCPNAVVSLSSRRGAEIRWDSAATARPARLRRVGNELQNEASPIIALHVPEMTCRSRVRAVTARVRDLPGVETVAANAATATLVVHGSVTEPTVRAVLAEMGFPAARREG